VSTVRQAQLLFQSGRVAEAVATMERAATAGDAEANYALGNWRLFGQYGPRDPAAAHRHLKWAGEKGHVAAIRARAYLTANGTGIAPDQKKAIKLLQKIAPRDPHAAAQLGLLAQMKPSAASAERRERLSDDPLVELVRGLFTPAECAYVMKVSEPALGPSLVVDPMTGREIQNPVRSSYGMNFGPMQEDLVINAINRRIAAATGTRASTAEPLYILRYTPGQEFKPHFDALPGVTNQRVLTALCYLNDGYAGGETVFPELGITVRGQAGDVLFFGNADAGGRGDPRTKHAGLPVTAGVKWLASRWIRQRDFDPFTKA
jgi:prolyl 4-hydroxylase